MTTTHIKKPAAGTLSSSCCCPESPLSLNARPHARAPFFGTRVTTRPGFSSVPRCLVDPWHHSTLQAAASVI